MDIRTRYYDDVAILAPCGRLDALSAPSLAAAISQQITTGYSRLVIDLKQVDFLSTSGIKALVDGLQEARRHGGDLRLANAQARIKQVLALAGIDRLVRLYTNVVSATASYFPGPLAEETTSNEKT